jgi:hypothetical protein
MNLTSFKKTSKTIGFVLFLMVVLAATIFLGKNASGLLSAKASACAVQNVQAVQVTTNAAVINWTTQASTQGIVQYGTDPSLLNFSKIEAQEGTTHNVPLAGTADNLTPNTTYFYVIKIKDATCDSTGQTCTDKCIPWNFTTTGVKIKGDEAVPTVAPDAASGSVTITIVPSKSPADTTLSAFCTQVEKNMGTTDKASNWSTLKQYDLDSNKLINTRDLNMCRTQKK